MDLFQWRLQHDIECAHRHAQDILNTDDPQQIIDITARLWGVRGSMKGDLKKVQAAEDAAAS